MSNVRVLAAVRLRYDCQWLCSIYVLTVLDLCFDCARLMFRLCSNHVSTVLDLFSTVLDLCFDWTRLIFWLWTTYVSTFSAENGYVSTVLDLSFDCARPIICLCSTYVSTFSTKIEFFLLSWPKFPLSRPILRLSRLKSSKVRLCARLKKNTSRPQNVSRKTGLTRLSKSKHQSSTTTREYFNLQH